MTEGKSKSFVHLDILTPEARKVFYARASDHLSFSDFLTHLFLEMASARENKAFDLEDLKKYVDYDNSAPQGESVECAYCLITLILNTAEKRYPNDEKVKFIVSAFDGMTKAVGLPPRETIDLQKHFDSTLKSWSVEELRALQEKFLNIRKEISESGNKSAVILPRRYAKIQAKKDDEDRGKIIEHDGRPVWIGNFVLINVNKRSAFRLTSFVLGLKPGYQILAGCGNPGDWRGHLYWIRNFQFKTSENTHQWQPLPANTYEDALNRKQRFEGDLEGTPAANIEELWLDAQESKPTTKEENLWIEGEELEKYLSELDPTVSHTMRDVVPRKNILTNEWEICLVLEKGDAASKTGDKEAKLSGKGPAWGLPGGRKEPNETAIRTAEREGQNETDFGAIKKIVALVAEIRKRKLPGHATDNIDHWLLVEVKAEHFASHKIVETDEIAEVRWVPISELANYTFQNSRRPVRDLAIIKAKRIMYFSHALQLSKILPRIPWIQIPENFKTFQKNVQEFQEKLQYS